jgi:lysozyme
MDTSPDGIKRIIQREGCKLKAYKDSGGVLTICVGHTSAAGPPKVRPGMTATPAECKAMLEHDLSAFEDVVERAVKVPVSQNEFDALVSLCYNIGPAAFRRSSVVRHLNKGYRAAAADAFLMWVKVKGKTIRGLVNRRHGERDQFLGLS